jgi:hypothetical protein
MLMPRSTCASSNWPDVIPFDPGQTVYRDRSAVGRAPSPAAGPLAGNASDVGRRFRAAAGLLGGSLVAQAILPAVSAIVPTPLLGMTPRLRLRAFFDNGTHDRMPQSYLPDSKNSLGSLHSPSTLV